MGRMAIVVTSLSSLGFPLGGRGPHVIGLPLRRMLDPARCGKTPGEPEKSRGGRFPVRRRQPAKARAAHRPAEGLGEFRGESPDCRGPKTVERRFPRLGGGSEARLESGDLGPIPLDLVSCRVDLASARVDCGTHPTRCPGPDRDRGETRPGVQFGPESRPDSLGKRGGDPHTREGTRSGSNDDSRNGGWFGSRRSQETIDSGKHGFGTDRLHRKLQLENGFPCSGRKSTEGDAARRCARIQR